jgi:hypothetical protein
MDLFCVFSCPCYLFCSFFAVIAFPHLCCSPAKPKSSFVLLSTHSSNQFPLFYILRLFQKPKPGTLHRLIIIISIPFVFILYNHKFNRWFLCMSKKEQDFLFLMLVHNYVFCYHRCPVVVWLWMANSGLLATGIFYQYRSYASC